MKILYLHQYFQTPSFFGGTRSYEMARRFVASGHQVHMITSWRFSEARGEGWRIEEIEGINVHWLSLPYSHHMVNRDRMRAFLKFAVAAGRRSVAVGGDVVFATSTPLTIALPGVYAAKRLKVPMVFEVRDLWPEVPIAVGALKNPLTIAGARWLEKFAYHNSAHIVALSKGMADGVEQAGYPRDNISVIPNCSNLQMFQNVEQKKQKFFEDYPHLNGGKLVVYTGTLGIANGVEYLVDIASAMQCFDASIKFLIVGDGRAASDIRKRAAELNVLNKNLWMLPEVSKDRVPGILSAATIATSFVIDLPELWHNSANKFFDALAAGRPIMINHKGWQDNLLRRTGAGISVPPARPFVAAQILRDFLNDSDRLVRARQAATHLATVDFNQDILAEKLLSILVREVERSNTPEKRSTAKNCASH